eukprot:scaffold6797_cov62-Cylindrotheca_fusiformis.AAC.5
MGAKIRFQRFHKSINTRMRCYKYDAVRSDESKLGRVSDSSHLPKMKRYPLGKVSWTKENSPSALQHSWTHILYFWAPGRRCHVLSGQGSFHPLPP